MWGNSGNFEKKLVIKTQGIYSNTQKFYLHKGFPEKLKVLPTLSWVKVQKKGPRKESD